MKKKIAKRAKIFFLLLPIWIIFIPLFVAIKFYIFKIEIVALAFLYVYFAFFYVKNNTIFPSIPLPKFIRTSIFFSTISSVGITIWYSIEGYFGNELINWFNAKISIPLLNNIYIQPQNLMAGQIGFISISFFLFILIFLVFMGIYYLDKSPNKKYFSKFKSFSLYLSLLSILTCLFSTELLQNNAGGRSVFWGGGTEDYLLYRIRNGLTLIEDIKEYGGFNHGMFMGEFKVYLSQTGFWGSVLKFIQALFNANPDTFIVGTRIVLSLIYSNIILSIGYKLKEKFGFISALLFILPQVITYWILGPVKHIIWFYPLLLAPFIHSLIRYPKILTKEITQKRFLLEQAIIFILVFLRGYTYLSNIILSAMVPILYYELQNKIAVKQLFKKLIPTGIIGGASLIIVLGLHLTQLTIYLGGASEALNYLKDKTVLRVGVNSTLSYWRLFSRWINVRFFYFPEKELLNLYYLDKLNYGVTIGSIHYFFFIVLSFSGYMKLKVKKINNIILKSKIETLFNVGLCTLFSMFSTWSWFINKGHMQPHSHMNGIMYIIPFGFVLYMFFGIFVNIFLEFLNYYIIGDISKK